MACTPSTHKNLIFWLLYLVTVYLIILFFPKNLTGEIKSTELWENAIYPKFIGKIKNQNGRYVEDRLIFEQDDVPPDYALCSTSYIDSIWIRRFLVDELEEVPVNDYTIAKFITSRFFLYKVT